MTTRTDPWQTLLFDTLLAVWKLESTAMTLEAAITTGYNVVDDASQRMDRATFTAVYQEAMDLFAIEKTQVMR